MKSSKSSTSAVEKNAKTRHTFSTPHWHGRPPRRWAPWRMSSPPRDRDAWGDSPEVEDAVSSPRSPTADAAERLVRAASASPRASLDVREGDRPRFRDFFERDDEARPGEGLERGPTNGDAVWDRRRTPPESGARGAASSGGPKHVKMTFATSPARKKEALVHPDPDATDVARKSTRWSPRRARAASAPPRRRSERRWRWHPPRRMTRTHAPRARHGRGAGGCARRARLTGSRRSAEARESRESRRRGRRRRRLKRSRGHRQPARRASRRATPGRHAEG